MTRHRAEWWAARVEELAEDGDPEAVARRHKVRMRTLVWWRAELARRAREASPPGPRLLPVVVASSAMRSPPGAEASIEVRVEVGEARLSVHGAVTAEHLSAIVGSLRGRC